MANIKQIQIGDNNYGIRELYRPYYKKAEVTGVAGTSSTKLSTTYDVTDSSITSYVDGLMVTFVLPVAGVGTYGSVFQINSLGYKPIVYNTNSLISTRYPVGSQITMVYNSVQTATAYLTANTATTVTGCWQIMDYDSNTTSAYSLIDYYFRPYNGANPIYRYKIVGLDKDNRLQPIVLTNQTSATQVAKTPNSVAFRPEKFWLYNTTTTLNASTVCGGQVLYSSAYGTSLWAYNLNASIGTYKNVYLRGTYDSTTGLFTLYNDSASPCKSYYTAVPNNTANITLSSYFTSGYYYILLGAAYSSTDYMQLFMGNPMYYFDGTNLIPAQQKVAMNYTDTAIGGAIANSY